MLFLFGRMTLIVYLCKKIKIMKKILLGALLLLSILGFGQDRVSKKLPKISTIITCAIM